LNLANGEGEKCYKETLSHCQLNEWFTLICNNCGRDITVEDALYCPYCALPLKLLKKRSGFPTAAGVLAFIAASIALIIGAAGLITSGVALSQRYFYSSTPIILYLVMGIFNSFAFAFALAGGICAVRRKRFVVALTGAILLLVSGLVTLAAFAMQGYFAIILGAMFSLPVLIMALLATIFVAVSKGEFE
jgi:hypothetical protein